MTKDLHRALLFLYAETPVHAGADTGLGALDLPIQREVSTKFPIIKGESLKGALREHTRPMLDEPAWTKMFGAAPPRAGTASGALSPGELRIHEAQLVAFPAPTLDGFAWVTGPLARARLDRKAGLAKVTSSSSEAVRPPDLDSAEDDDIRCLMTNTSSRGRKRLPITSVVLGSYTFTAVGDPGLNRWAEWLSTTALPEHGVHTFFRDKLRNDLYQVPDPALMAISRECTHVAARVQLGALDDDRNPTKSVEHGPFYSEYLPSESLLVALLESASPRHIPRLAELIHGRVIQIGGDETIGKGVMWCTIAQPLPEGGLDPERSTAADPVASGASQ